MCSIFLSGRASSNLTLDCLKRAGVVKPGDDHLPYTSAHCITVPGAAAAWCDTVEQFGSGEVLSNCNDLLGVPFHSKTSHQIIRLITFSIFD